LTRTQLWAILVSVLAIPVLSALALPTFTQGAPFAALIYIATLWTALRRISRDHSRTKNFRYEFRSLPVKEGLELREIGPLEEKGAVFGSHFDFFCDCAYDSTT
jgi:hypothetical protein